MKSTRTKISDTNPFGLRMAPEVRHGVEKKAEMLERSLNWTINELLKQALGLKEQSP